MSLATRPGTNEGPHCAFRGERIRETKSSREKGYGRATYSLEETPVAETYAALARDSNGRGHGRSASGPRDQTSQRPGASRPSSVPPGSLGARQVQKRQDASVVPYQLQGAQHSGVERPLDDGLGVGRVAGCLDGRQTVAPSSLRAKPSRTTDVLSVRPRLQWKGDRGKGKLRRRAPEKRQQAAFSVSGRRPRRLWIEQTRETEASIGTSAS